MRRRAGVRRAAIGAIVAVALLLLQLGATTIAGAAFTSQTGNPGSELSSDTLSPVSDLTAARPCSLQAPTFRSKSDHTSVGTPSHTIAKPAGVMAGDVLVAMLIHSDQSNTPTPPSGWTTLHSAGDNHRSLLAYRVATGSEGTSYTFAVDGTDLTAGTILAYSGANSASPILASAVSAPTTGSTTLTAPSLNATEAGLRLITGFLVDDYSGVLSTPATITQRTTVTATASGTQPLHLGVFDRAPVEIGATGTTTATIATSQSTSSYSLLLRGTPGPVTVAWTATPDTYASGYVVSRSDGLDTTLSGRDTTSHQDATLASTSAATYTVRARFLSWRSSAVSASVPVC